MNNTYFSSDKVKVFPVVQEGLEGEDIREPSDEEEIQLARNSTLDNLPLLSLVLRRGILATLLSSDEFSFPSCLPAKKVEIKVNDASRRDRGTGGEQSTIKYTFSI